MCQTNGKIRLFAKILGCEKIVKSYVILRLIFSRLIPKSLCIFKLIEKKIYIPNMSDNCQDYSKENVQLQDNSKLTNSLPNQTYLSGFL